MTNERFLVPLLATLTSFTLLTVGCGKKEGTEGGSCYRNATCDAGLICRSKLCVDPNDSGLGDGSGSGGGGGVDVTACLECGEGQCTAEADACNAASGCAELLSCWIACAGDASCANACDISNVQQSDLSKVGPYFSCVAQKCVDDCIPDTSAGDGDGSTNPGAACTTPGQRRGSCQGGDPEVCRGGVWIEDSCDGCGIVQPQAQCSEIDAFVLLETGTGDQSTLVLVDNQETNLVQTATSVTAQWYLEANQMGVLQFRFASSVDPMFVQLNGIGIDLAGFENSDGSGGCSYRVTQGFLERVINTRHDEEWDDYVVDWWGCWGIYADFTSEDPPGLTVLNLRTPLALSNTEVSMSVFELNL